MSATKQKSLAVIGGGWAGCAAAVALADAGHAVTIYEAARTLGGRARAVDAHGRQLDNGQHIMLGAYDQTLGLLRRVGVKPRDALLRLPLQMRYPPGRGLMDFVAPPLPAPLHMLAALLRATGLSGADKLALARFSTTARWMGWQLHQDCSVAELLERYDQTPTLIRQMWRPLCLAALNTAPEHASSQVFLAVLRDSLGAKRTASDMLLPRLLLDQLFPEAARKHVEARAGRVLTGTRAESIGIEADGRWRVSTAGGCVKFDGVVLAAAPWQAAALLRSVAGVDALAAQLEAFAYEPISTIYLQYDPALRLPLPFCALLDDPAHGRWGQFVFDRGQLDPGQAGLLAVVISGASDASNLAREELAGQVAAQLAAAFQNDALARPAWQQVITEKRATFSCTPGLARPPVATSVPGLVLAGDYTACDYPATLESAVRSGLQAAKALGGSARRG